MTMTPASFTTAFNLAFACTMESILAMDDAMREGKIAEALRAREIANANATALDELTEIAFTYGFAPVV